MQPAAQTGHMSIDQPSMLPSWCRICLIIKINNTSKINARKKSAEIETAASECNVESECMITKDSANETRDEERDKEKAASTKAMQDGKENSNNTREGTKPFCIPDCSVPDGFDAKCRRLHARFPHLFFSYRSREETSGCETVKPQAGPNSRHSENEALSNGASVRSLKSREWEA